MKRAQEIARLQQVTQLMLDHHLSRLHAAAQGMTETETALAHLSGGFIAQDGFVGATGQLAALAHQRWADTQRRDLTQRLARQAAEVAALQAEARQAWGKCEALRALTDRLKDRPQA